MKSNLWLANNTPRTCSAIRFFLFRFGFSFNVMQVSQVELNERAEWRLERRVVSLNFHLSQYLIVWRFARSWALSLPRTVTQHALDSFCGPGRILSTIEELKRRLTLRRSRLLLEDGAVEYQGNFVPRSLMLLAMQMSVTARRRDRMQGNSIVFKHFHSMPSSLPPSLAWDSCRRSRLNPKWADPFSLLKCASRNKAKRRKT